MSSSIDFRSEQARKMAELIAQSRNLDEQHQATNKQSSSPIESENDVDPTRINNQAPAYRADHYAKNVSSSLVHADQTYAQGHQDPTKQVVQSKQAGIDYDRPNSPNQSVSLRNPVTNPKLRGMESEEPMHEAQPKKYEEIITNNEEQIEKLKHAPTTGAVAELGTPAEQAQVTSSTQAAPETNEQASTADEGKRTEKTQDATTLDVLENSTPVSSPEQAEVTNINFQYEPQASHWSELYEGIESGAGEGAPVEVDDRTQTQVVTPRFSNEKTFTIARDEIE